VNLNHEMQIKLFNLLTEIEPLLEKFFIDKDKIDLDLLLIIKIRDNLSTFSKNFFIQFFSYGYDFLIEGINETVLKKLINFNPYPKRKPKGMIECFSTFIKINRDLLEDRYSRKLKIAPQFYCKFLPQLFDIFKKEGKGIILNYNEIMRVIETTMQNIKKICN